MAENTTNIGKLAMASLILGLMINLIIWGYSMSNADKNGLYPTTIMNMFQKDVPTNYLCKTGDETCTQELQNTPSEDTGLIDKTQQLINVIAVIGGMLAVIFLTPIFPSILGIKISAFITSVWIIGLINIFTSLWTILNLYLIYMLLFKKW